MKNYYDLLEIHPDSSQEVIEASYKSLYKHYDPDNFSSSEEKMQAKIRRNQIKEAYKILSNPPKKAKYDKYFKEKGGRVEMDKNPNETILIFIAIAIVIVIFARYLADLLFKHFAQLTLLITNTPVLSIILALIVTGIVIHFFWKKLHN